MAGKSTEEKNKALKALLVHLAVFVAVNLILFFGPVFYDGTVDFSFKDREPLLYGSIGWGIGLFIHGLVVLIDRLFARKK